MLDEFFDGVNEIPYKNNGGCLFFCYVFLLWATKKEIDLTTFRIVQYELSGTSNIKNNQKFFEGLTTKANSSTHFTWIFENTEYDGYGKSPKQYYNNWVFNQSPETLEKFCINALVHGTWNNQFDRDEAINIVEENLGLKLDSKI